MAYGDTTRTRDATLSGCTAQYHSTCSTRDATLTGRTALYHSMCGTRDATLSGRTALYHSTHTSAFDTRHSSHCINIILSDCSICAHRIHCGRIDDERMWPVEWVIWAGEGQLWLGWVLLTQYSSNPLSLPHEVCMSVATSTPAQVTRPTTKGSQPGVAPQ